MRALALAPLPAPGQPIVQISGLRSAFDLPEGGRVVIHENLNLTVNRGEVLTLVD